MSETSTPTPTTERNDSSPDPGEWNPPYYELEGVVEEKLRSLSPLDVYRVGIDPVMDMGIQTPETWGGPPDELGRIMLALLFQPNGNTLNTKARMVLRELLRHSVLAQSPIEMTQVMCRIASGWLVEYAAGLRAVPGEDQEA